jgi:DNA polymerase-3 subunit gamma/tau
MSYFVFARKYRPQKFSDVLAQRHITETLTKAVINDRITQSYLFCGVRGTGKTSVARILAKRLNCANPQGADPCDECDSCVAIIKGRSLDILEIDAASHTSVDDIRELREAIKYAPVGGKRKVYIIDEVHRLSGSAFDALLKTLEEPPAHAVFIFATTEVHKVPQTILSRCQRYDFKRIPESALREALAAIAEKENLQIESAALAELARRGDGSLRDALSILDQVASWQNETITLDLLTDALGILPRSEYRGLLAAIKGRKVAVVIRKIDEVLKAGVGAAEFVRGFQEELRMLLLFKAAPEVGPDYGVTDEEAKTYIKMAQDYSLNDLLRVQNLLVGLEQKIRDGFDPQINIELTLLKLIEMGSSISVEEALRHLSGQGVVTSQTESSPPTPDSKKKEREVVSSTVSQTQPGPDAESRPEPPLPPQSMEIPPDDNSAVVTSQQKSVDLDEVWRKLLTALKPTHRNVHIKLSLAQPRGIEGNKIRVAYDRFGEVHVQYFRSPEIQQTLETVVRNATGRVYQFQFFVDPQLEHRTDGGKRRQNLFVESEKSDHPVVEAAMRIFDAEIVERRDID